MIENEDVIKAKERKKQAEKELEEKIAKAKTKMILDELKQRHPTEKWDA